MPINKAHIRLIFGLKVRQLRHSQGLSLLELSQATGISVSYLNEIEKGKKYPKTDKIISLAQVLGVNYDHLVSIKLSKKLAPVADLLSSGILEALPLEVFGLETSTLLALISEAPSKINAFISTILGIARSHEIRKENFYLAALRAYQEMHDNYFEELEQEVQNFVRDFRLTGDKPLGVVALADILFEDYQYTLDRHTIGQIQELRWFRSIALPEKKLLHLNQYLSPKQEAFILAKEIAFLYLGLTERPLTSTIFPVHSFEEALNNFKASYFAVALLINQERMVEDLKQYFSQSYWDPAGLEHLLEKYQATPEMLFSRLSNLLPTFFGIDNFFFLRLSEEEKTSPLKYHITKELHISGQHNPHRNDLNEHYCRRWVSIKVLEGLPEKDPQTPYLIEAQRSRFMSTDHEYLCLAIARPSGGFPLTHTSVSFGIQINVNSQAKIRFLSDPNIPLRVVNETCERCAIPDCQERVADPSIVEKKLEHQSIQLALNQLLNQKIPEY